MFTRHQDPFVLGIRGTGLNGPVTSNRITFPFADALVVSYGRRFLFVCDFEVKQSSVLKDQGFGLCPPLTKGIESGIHYAVSNFVVTVVQ